MSYSPYPDENGIRHAPLGSLSPVRNARTHAEALAELTFAKDKFEQGLAILQKAGYTEKFPQHIDAVKLIKLIRLDIFIAEKNLEPLCGKKAP